MRWYTAPPLAINTGYMNTCLVVVPQTDDVSGAEQLEGKLI